MLNKKIIVFGFPHCGTTILKSIIGHIDDVDEIIDEKFNANKESSKKYILCKYPHTYDFYFKNNYNDYIKIFIIRNPVWVFSSINRRFGYREVEKHRLDDYVNTLEKFIYYRENKLNNLYLIRYEDMFKDNFKNLKDIFMKIGLKFTDKIFDNSLYVNKNTEKIKEIPKNMPKEFEHSKFRAYQINQPIINFNNISKIDLNDSQIKFMLNSKIIRKVYPNIDIIINKYKKISKRQ